MINITIRILCFCFLLGSTATAQVNADKELTTNSNRAKRNYEQGIQEYRLLNYKEAEAALKKAVAFDTGFVEAYLLLGDLYLDNERLNEAVSAYGKAIDADEDFYIPIYKILGEIELDLGQYRNALDHFRCYLDFEQFNEQEAKSAQQGINQCLFAIKQMENPVPFNPVNMGDSINSAQDEYINAITADEAVLIFTSKTKPKKNEFPAYRSKQEDFYLSENEAGEWSKAKEIGYPINTPGNEGALCISPDGQMLFITACNRKDGYGSCDIYFSRRSGNQWSRPLNLGSEVNSKYWDSQPSVSSDGRTLYFASTRPGGIGSSDIWKTNYTRENKWTKPKNLGKLINTKKEEMAPFIHPDDQTLYFSSKGHMGMGKADLFYTRRDSTGIWQKPNNVGYPINTHSDEINIIVNAAGKKAYLSSDKLGGKGNFDIYQFELYKAAQPKLVTYLKGNVYDANSKKPLEAHFELQDVSTGKTHVESYSDPKTGEFLVCLPVEHNWALNVTKNGYMFYSEHFALIESSREDPYSKNIALQPIEAGARTVLNNIFFDTDEYILKPQSKVELNQIVHFIDQHSTLQVLIAGHTDSIGYTSYNKELSENRAKAVYNYLIDRGIEKKRLSYKGFGELQPIADNCTARGRARNRRTEFVILSHSKP